MTRTRAARIVYRGPAYVASRKGRELYEVGISNIIDHGNVYSVLSYVLVAPEMAEKARAILNGETVS